MSIIDKLLATDPKKLETKYKKEYEIKRLSELMGEPFILTCSPLTHRQIEHVFDISKGNETVRQNTVLEGCRLEGKKFTDEVLRKKFGVVSGIEVVEKIFLPGETFELYRIVNAISGYADDVVTEVKN